MARPLRKALGGLIYHVINRANLKTTIFETEADFSAFEKILREAQIKIPMRLLAYCIMPNHWHLVLWPHNDGDLSAFMAWLTTTHARRWYLSRGNDGMGHLYQGRFKSFPVQSDNHFLVLCRYVERNPLRAGFVSNAQEWRWSSLWRTLNEQPCIGAELCPWPVRRKDGWLDWVNQPQTAEELATLRQCVARGQPLGERSWTIETVKRLGLRSVLRPRGRPKNGV